VLSQLTPQEFAPLEAVFKRGRFKEEFNVEVKLGGVHLCHIKIFTGRPPYYKPWAEVFNMSPRFVGGPWEGHVYCVLHRFMKPAAGGPFILPQTRPSSPASTPPTFIKVTQQPLCNQAEPRAPSKPPRLDAEGLVQKLFITATRRSALFL